MGYPLWSNDRDDQHERRDDADEDALHFRVVGYEPWLPFYVGL